MQLKEGQPPGGLFKLGFRVKVPKEGNWHEGLNKSYEILECALVMRLV